MSRIGKNPITVPDGVEVSIEGNEVSVKGRLGKLHAKMPNTVALVFEDGMVRLSQLSEIREARAALGMSRALVANMVTGVSEGFTRHLEIEGVGYRATMKGKDLLTLQLGYSHEICVSVPDDLTVTCPRPIEIEISGADKQRVGQLAAEIRAFRKPEPYKGKGVRYRGEHIRRKEGKTK